MAHIHSVYDTDKHFSIEPSTRALVNQTPEKACIMQYDHDSERITFDLPATVEGHKILDCNRVEVHYLNIDAKTEEQRPGLYEVDDLQLSPADEAVAICSWLISGNATQLVGPLYFRVTFKCVTEGTLDYSWSTAIYKGLTVSDGINCTEYVADLYADILAQWMAHIDASTETAENSAHRAENAAQRAENSARQAENAAGSAEQSAQDTAAALTNHNTHTEAHADLRLELKALADRINAALDSDDTTLDELSEIVAYIKSNKSLIDAITTSKVNVTDIVNNLVTNVANKPLSAAQGVAIKALIDALQTAVDNALTPEELAASTLAKDVARLRSLCEAMKAGYTPLEYIQSTGTQYINTGVSAPNGFRFVGKVQFTKLPTAVGSSAAVIGAYDTASPYYRNFLTASVGNDGICRWLIGAHDFEYFDEVQTSTDYEIDVSTGSGNLHCRVNGVNQLLDFTPSSERRSANTLYLGALNIGSASEIASVKLWPCQIYVDGTLVRDYIPCKSPSGVVGLYDLVNGQFYGNAGSGEFLGNGLPSGYTRLDYIESTGTQYIDAGFIPSNHMVEMKYEDTEYNPGTVFGTDRASNAWCYFHWSQIDNNFLWGKNGSQNQYSYYSGVKTLKYNHGENHAVILNDVVLGQGAPIVGDAPLLIFRRSDGPWFKGKLYYFKVTDKSSGTLVRDFVPCRSASGVVGLYDLLNSKFYGNAGTGEFVCDAPARIGLKTETLQVLLADGTTATRTVYVV